MPAKKGEFVHDIIVEAWKRMPLASSIGVEYSVPNDDFKISARYEGRAAWIFCKREHYLTNPEQAMSGACAFLVSELQMKDDHEG